MFTKMFNWIRSRFSGTRKVKSPFDKDNPFLIL
jgi:hypothetical protein